ncbi:MAG: FUSC family protein [Jatrophihabitans sp.]
MIIGTMAGGAEIGLAATVGALQTCFADRPGPYLLRTLRMLGVAVAAGTTSTLAVLASRSDLASAGLLLVLALLAGLLLTAGPSAAQFGVAATASAVILGHIPQPPGVAVHVGLMILAGGAVQVVLAVAAWPLGRHRPERAALASLYRALAAGARAQRGSAVGPPAGDALTAARKTLYGLGHDHGPSVEAYRVLLDQAERIRREIVVLTAAAERLAGDRNPILAGLVRGALTAAGDVLDAIAVALSKATDVDGAELGHARAAIRTAVERLEQSTDAPGEPTRRAAAARLRALAGQVRAAVESTRAGAGEGRHGDESQGTAAALLRDPLAVLRANLTPSSAVLRHAIRLAVLVAGSDYLVRLVGIERGYWVALTVLVVMRPDFGTTLQRSVMRVIGTVVGLVVATGLVHWIPGGDWWHIALIAVFAFGMRFAGPGNVALSAVSLSALVVVLLQIEGVPAHETLVARSLSTLVGGVLAVLAALTLPVWERRYLPLRLAQLLSAYRAYVAAVADPAADRARLQTTRTAARLARSNAQASLDRARAEPVRAQEQIELAATVLANTHRFVHAAVALDAVRRTVRLAGGLPRLQTFLGTAGDVLGSLEVALRTGATCGPVPGLRPLQEALVEELTGDPGAAGGLETATTVIEATDRMANSLDTLVYEMRRQVNGPHEAAPLDG